MVNGIFDNTILNVVFDSTKQTFSDEDFSAKLNVVVYCTPNFPQFSPGFSYFLTLSILLLFTLPNVHGARVGKGKENGKCERVGGGGMISLSFWTQPAFIIFWISQLRENPFIISSIFIFFCLCVSIYLLIFLFLFSSFLSFFVFFLFFSFLPFSLPLSVFLMGRTLHFHAPIVALVNVFSLHYNTSY